MSFQSSNLKILTVAFAAGVLFAIGLALSGMTSPHIVIGFLDITGDWDPRLAFVMIGAIPVHFVTYRFISQRSVSFLGEKFSWPTRKDLSPQLIMGAALFGIGWGMAGFCPGPGITSVVSGQWEPLVFVFMMLAGMALYKLLEPTIPFRK